MIEALLTTPCTVHHVTDPAGDVDDEGRVTATTTDIPAVCHIQPYRLAATLREEVRGELVTVGRWRCWLPAGTTVGAADTVTAQGSTRQVFGEPEQWSTPDGSSVRFVYVELRAVA